MRQLLKLSLGLAFTKIGLLLSAIVGLGVFIYKNKENFKTIFEPLISAFDWVFIKLETFFTKLGDLLFAGIVKLWDSFRVVLKWFGGENAVKQMEADFTMRKYSPAYQAQEPILAPVISSLKTVSQKTAEPSSKVRIELSFKDVLRGTKTNIDNPSRIPIDTYNWGSYGAILIARPCASSQAF